MGGITCSILVGVHWLRFRTAGENIKLEGFPEASAFVIVGSRVSILESSLEFRLRA